MRKRLGANEGKEMAKRRASFLPYPEIPENASPVESFWIVLAQRDLEKPLRRVSYWGETGCSVVGIILESS